jgi:hypothetical protein
MDYIGRKMYENQAYTERVNDLVIKLEQQEPVPYDGVCAPISVADLDVIRNTEGGDAVMIVSPQYADSYRDKRDVYSQVIMS